MQSAAPAHWQNPPPYERICKNWPLKSCKFRVRMAPPSNFQYTLRNGIWHWHPEIVTDWNGDWLIVTEIDRFPNTDPKILHDSVSWRFQNCVEPHSLKHNNAGILCLELCPNPNETLWESRLYILCVMVQIYNILTHLILFISKLIMTKTFLYCPIQTALTLLTTFMKAFTWAVVMLLLFLLQMNFYLLFPMNFDIPLCAKPISGYWWHQMSYYNTLVGTECHKRCWGRKEL